MLNPLLLKAIHTTEIMKTQSYFKNKMLLELDPLIWLKPFLMKRMSQPEDMAMNGKLLDGHS